MDYISREAAIKEMAYMMHECFPEAVEELDAVITTLKEIPAADVVEARHGTWCVTDAYPHNVYCSECYKTFAQKHWEIWQDGSLPRDYCHNCGAKMDGGQEPPKEEKK